MAGDSIPLADHQAHGLRELVNIGHRGASAYAPENTIAAYDLALSLGAHYLELDVHITRDGALVVVHDASLERTGRLRCSPTDGLISTKTLEELTALDVGSWFNEVHTSHRRDEFVGLTIPTLDEVIDRYRHCARFCIELKSATDGRVERELVRVLEAHRLHEPKNGAWRVLVMSFDAPTLEALHELHPYLPLIQLVSPDADRETIVARLDDAARVAVGIAPPKHTVDAELVSGAHAQALRVSPYTVNETDEMARLISIGVDRMITDCPDRLDALLWRRASVR